MDVAHLQVQVTSRGVTNTVSALDKLEKKAGAAETAVKSLTAQVTNLTTAQGGLSSATQAAAKAQLQAYSQLDKAISTLTGQLSTMTALMAQLGQTTLQTTAQSNALAGSLQRKSQWGNVWTSTMKAMITAAGAYLSLNFAKGIIQAADSWQSMQAKLTIVTGTTRAAKHEQQAIYDLAQRMRAPLEDMTKLYQRMVTPLETIGKSSEQAKKHVEFLALGLKLSGSTAAEASSTMLQYSQAINAGRLNGAEFNAVAEASPVVLLKIKEYLMATSEEFRKSGGNLKKWASEGKITVEVMQAAAEAALPRMQEQFKTLPVTVDDVLTRIKNAWTKTVGEIGQDTELGKKMVAALESLEDNLPKIAATVVQALAFMAEHFRTLIVLATTLVGIGIMKWAMEARAGLLAAAAAANIAAGATAAVGAAGTAAATGMTAGATAAGVARVALSALGGPLGLIAGLLTAGVTAWMMWGDKTKEVSKTTTEVVLSDLDKVIEKLDVEIERLKEKARLKKLLGDGAVDAAEGNDNLTAINKALAEIKTTEAALQLAREGAMTGDEDSIKAVRQYTQELDKLNKKLDEATAKQAEFASANAADQAAKLKVRQDSYLNNFDETYGTKQMKMAAAIRAEEAKAAELGLKLNEKQIQMIRDKFKTETTSLSANERLTKTYRDQLEAIEKQNNSLRAKGTKTETHSEFDKATDEVVNVYNEIAKNQEKINEGVDGKVKLNKEEIGLLEQANAKLREQAAITLQNGIAKDEDEAFKKALAKAEAAKEKLDSYLDANKADRFGNAMASAFGKVGKAIGQAGDALIKFHRRGEAAEKAKANAKAAYLDGPVKDEVKYARAVGEIEKQQAADRIDMYADVLQASKGFFKEHTAAYKVLHAAEQAFRVYQYASAVKNAAVEMGLIEATTVARIQGYAMAAWESIKSTGIQIAQAMGLGGVLATLGVMTQAQGDPYSAWARMAAMAAVMAGLGFAVSGAFGGGGRTQNAPKFNEGKGTVFGDADAQSKSIARSIEKLKDVDTMTMRYSAQMLDSLRNIEASMAGVTNLVLRNGKVNTGEQFGDLRLGKQTAKGLIEKWTGSKGFLEMFNPAFKAFQNSPIARWLRGSETRELTNAGVAMKGTLAQLIAGQGMSEFSTVKTTSKRWYRGTKTSYEHHFDSLDATIARQFGLIFDSFGDAINAAGEALGVPLTEIQQRLQGFVVDLGMIDLKGLSGEEIQERLSAALGAAGDELAAKALPGFLEFQRVGEGYLETVVRVGSGVEQAQYELEKLGITALHWSLILNKQAEDVGGELVKQSIMWQEWGTGIGEIIMSLDGTASEIADIYRELKTVQSLMVGVGLGSNLTRDLIRAAGGLDALHDALGAYSENFFSEAEQRAMKGAQLAVEFQKLGRTMPQTKEGFRALVESLKAAGNTEMAVKVMLLAESFAEWADMAGSASQAVEEARDNLRDAYEREKSAIEEVQEKWESFAKSLRDFKADLITSDLSPLTNQEKYATLRAQFESTRAAAMSGDEDAIGKFESIAREFLTFSREFNASGVAYTADFQRVLDATTQLEGIAGTKASDAEKQLAALEKQVEGLIEINESVLTVAQAIAALQAAMTGTANPPAVSVDNTSAIPTTPDRSTALAAELAAVRQELTTLREEQAKQTVALIAATVESNEQNAAVVVNGLWESDSVGSYRQRAPQAMN
jgi:tape measure domain-containing protein